MTLAMLAKARDRVKALKMAATDSKKFYPAKTLLGGDLKMVQSQRRGRWVRQPEYD